MPPYCHGYPRLLTQPPREMQALEQLAHCSRRCMISSVQFYIHTRFSASREVATVVPFEQISNNSHFSVDPSDALM